MATWGNRTAAIPGAMGLSRQTFEELERVAKDFDTASREYVFVMDVVAELHAKFMQARCQWHYRGPVGGRPWLDPVARLTSETYQGWYVKKVGLGIWRTANPTRGAIAVEFGIFRGGHARRRPIMKTSVIETLAFSSTTALGKRVLKGTFGNLRDNHGHFKSSAAIFSMIPGAMGYVSRAKGGG